MQSHMAVEVFKNMKYCDLPPDAATYNIMIDCCSIIRCFKSASALLSMMLRDGFCPHTCTYTALIKVCFLNLLVLLNLSLYLFQPNWCSLVKQEDSNSLNYSIRLASNIYILKTT